jgi:uncharacterized protein
MHQGAPVVAPARKGLSSPMSHLEIQEQAGLGDDDQSQADPRRVVLSAVPCRGTSVTSIDLDLTLDCNMRCVYCFKEKRHEQMPKRVAFDSVLWLLHASGRSREVRVNFMGGEPLLAFELIQKLVPFAKRRAAYHGKKIHFGATTNNTLVTDEIVAFWRRWGMGFHCSIDGVPAVQSKNRPLVGGGASSEQAERGIAKILAYRPGTTARATIAPETVGYISENYHYFRSLGFTNIAMVPSDASDWTDPTIAELARQFLQVAEFVMDEMRQGRFIRVKGIDEYCEGEFHKKDQGFACGAGRGMALIDVHGGIWPCHRWNKGDHGKWRLGSIYDGYTDDARESLDVAKQSCSMHTDCASCDARRMCGGGCLAENLEETGDVYRPHPNKCKLTDALVHAGRRVYEQLSAEQNEVFLKQYSPKSDDNEGNDDATEAATR